MPKTVITTTCMNRNEYLLFSMREWVKMDLPIVIVDWSSTMPVRETLKDYLDKVTIVELRGEKLYGATQSKNLSYRSAWKLYPDMEYVFSLDCDVFPKNHEGFFERYPLLPGVVYTGGPVTELAAIGTPHGRGFTTAEDLADHGNRYGTCGTFVCSMALLDAVNMIDERMTGHGVYDENLYNRMKRHGATEICMQYGELFHQPHSARGVNYVQTSIAKGRPANVRIAKYAPPWEGCRDQVQKFKVFIGDVETVI